MKRKKQRAVILLSVMASSRGGLTRSQNSSIRAVSDGLRRRWCGVQTPVTRPSSIVVHCELHAREREIDIRKTFYTKFDFKMLNKKTQLQYLLGEKQDCILLATRYIH